VTDRDPTTGEATFRPAVEADWPEVWRVFRAVVAPGDTYTYPADIDEQAARDAWFHVGEAPTVTYVAELDDDVIGTALLKPNLPGRGAHVANGGWMVHPDVAGRGLGRRFAEYVIEQARALGFSAMQFNAVVATNARALALWRSLGFETIGVVPGGFRHPTDGAVDLHIMFRTL